MKKAIIFTFLFISSIIISQELDDEFLDSLPSSVRDDVLEKIEAQEDIDKPIYRRASTSIDKDEDELDESLERRVFGAIFFDTIQSSYMPINEPNLDSSYTLDFGDVLEVQLVGQENITNKYTVQRDGSINLKDIGKLFISGQDLKEATNLIKSKINSAYIGTEAFVSLINIRDISVLISGNAYNPGIFTLNGNSNMLHALSMAGGINEFGSYRDIQLIRDGKIISTLDIYEALVYGKSNFSVRLRSGDSIVVKPAKKIVSIESGVLRPGLYELKEDENFSDLINYASGLSVYADTDNIILKRIENGDSKVIDIDYKNIDKYVVRKGDGLFIRQFKFNTVTIRGAVKNPGTYLLPLGTKLSELIQSAGGYEQSAYPFGGYLKNKNSIVINEDSKEKLYNKFLNNLITNSRVSGNGQETDGLALVLEQLQDAPVTGRVIAEFDLDVIKANPITDTILEDQDEILIPNVTQQVYIQGEVSNPGAIRYSPGKDFQYYIDGSGGALDSADIETIFVVHPNGETENLNKNTRLSFFSERNTELLIYPGSIIYVPRTSSLINSLEIASIWAPIISSVALSLTSLSVLNNNN